MAITTLFETSEGRVGHSGPLLLTSMQESTTLGFLDALDRVQAKLIETYPKLSSINVMSHTNLKVDEQTRARGVALTDKFEKHGLATAIVVLSRGLSGVGVRTALSMYFMASRGGVPTKVFPSVAEGLSWLQTFPGQEQVVKMLSPLDLEPFFTQPAVSKAAST
jgi:hypothetical protein